MRVKGKKRTFSKTFNIDFFDFIVHYQKIILKLNSDKSISNIPWYSDENKAKICAQIISIQYNVVYLGLTKSWTENKIAEKFGRENLDLDTIQECYQWILRNDYEFVENNIIDLL